MAELTNQTNTYTNPPKAKKSFYNGLAPYQNNQIIHFRKKYVLDKFIIQPSPRKKIITKLKNILKDMLDLFMWLEFFFFEKNMIHHLVNYLNIRAYYAKDCPNKFVDLTLQKSIVGALEYSTITRPNI